MQLQSRLHKVLLLNWSRENKYIYMRNSILEQLDEIRKFEFHTIFKTRTKHVRQCCVEAQVRTFPLFQINLMTTTKNKNQKTTEKRTKFSW